MASRWILAILLAALAGQARAQAEPPSPVPSGELAEQMHEGLRKLRSTMEQALNDRDIDTIVDNILDDVVFTTMNGDVVRGRQEVRDYFERMMNGPERVVASIESRFVADALSVLLNETTAVAYGHSDDHYTLANGSELDVAARWSGTMQRVGNRWYVASFHYSTNMFDNPILSEQRRVLLAAAAVLALLTGGLGVWLGRRRTPAA